MDSSFFTTQNGPTAQTAQTADHLSETPSWALGCPRKLGSMARINGLFHLLINGEISWGYNSPTDPITIDPFTSVPGHPSRSMLCTLLLFLERPFGRLCWLCTSVSLGRLVPGDSGGDLPFMVWVFNDLLQNPLNGLVTSN